jgi:hypothetical protein
LQGKELSGNTQYAMGPLDQIGLGSGHTTTWARAKLQLAIYEFQYVLQHIVIKRIIAYKPLMLVFFLHFSVALAQTQLASQPPQP